MNVSRKSIFMGVLSILIAPTLAKANVRCFESHSGSFARTGKDGESNPEKTVRAILKIAGIQIGKSGVNEMEIKDPRFFRRVLSDPSLALGETYMDGMWDSPAIDRVTEKLFSAQLRGHVPIRSFWRTPALAALALLRENCRYYRDRFTNRQTRDRSKRVAQEHYDVGNDLYRQMLDPTLTYTSGIWRPGFSLEDAQNAKYDLIARKLALKPGQHVLDIGSGFGGFALFAAKYYGARVTGVTISVEQLKAARALSLGIPGVNFVFSDYRDIPHRFPPNTFDHVVSIEMIEAVGIKNLEEYFHAAAASLKDGGHFVIQSISSNVDVVNSNPWFSKYIFHDGVTPSTAQVDRAANSTFGSPVDRQRITDDYDKTLMAWHDNFTHAWPELKDRYSERFKRMWDFYLLSVAGGFRARALELDQTIYVKGNSEPVPIPVRDLPEIENLKSMRLSEKQKERIQQLIGELEIDKATIDAAAKPRSRRGQPLPRNARIAVIGAGPSGISSALELKKLGFTNVVVFEKDGEAGGKSHTVGFSSRPHDLGATMGVKFKYAEVERLAKEQGQATIPFPEQVDYSLARGGPTQKSSIRRRVSLAFQALLFMIDHVKTRRNSERGLEVPTSEMSDPWQVVMSRKGWNEFGQAMKTYLTGYGYGGPETPAIFGYRMMDPHAVLGSALANPIMWENGTQPIWKGAAKALDVRVNTEIEKIDRSHGDVRIQVKGSREIEIFDKIIVATDPSMTLKMLDSTAEERSLFSQVKYMPYATFAVRVDGMAEGRSEVGYLPENMRLDRMGRPMAWIKRYADDNIFVFHLFAPRNLSDDQVMARIAEDMKQLGATSVKLEASRRWPFFPHVDEQTMREEKFYERAMNLQGLNNTIFVNESLAMSTMPDSAEQGRKAAQRLASGEYVD